MTERVDGYTIYLDPGNLLGSGMFGQVYRCVRNDTGLGVAVKKVQLHRDPDYMKYIEREEHALQAVSHTNITKLYYIKKFPNVIYFFMELCSADLDTYVEARRDISQDVYIGFMLGIAHAVQHLHHLNPPLIHRDIKPGNVLIKTESGREVVKLADFGLARPAVKGATQISATLCGTNNYMAPEVYPDVHQEVHYGTPVDVFSTGVLFLAMIERRPGNPLKSYKVGVEALGKVMADQMKLGRRMEPPVHMQPTDTAIQNKLKVLISQMIFQRPTHRCSMDTVVGTLEHIQETSGGTYVHEGMATLDISADAGGEDSLAGAVGGEPARAPLRLTSEQREFTAAPGSTLNVNKMTSFPLTQETHLSVGIAENDIIVQDKDNLYRYRFIKNEFKLMWTKPKPTQINGYCRIVISNDSAILMQIPDYSSPTYAYDADLQFVQKHQHVGRIRASLPDGALVYILEKADDECSLMVHTAAREDIHLSPPPGITWGQHFGVCASTDGGYVVTEQESQFLGIYDKAGNLVTQKKVNYAPYGIQCVTRCGASHLVISEYNRASHLHVHSAISGEHLHTLTAQQLGVQEYVYAVKCTMGGQLMVITGRTGPNTTGLENWMLSLHAYQLDA